MAYKRGIFKESGKLMEILKKMWYDLETRGEIFKNVGLGFFVNAGYGLTLSNVW